MENTNTTNKFSLEADETWASETEPIFMRDGKYYFFSGEGWTEMGPFADKDDCRMSFEAHRDTSEYLYGV